MEIKDLLHRKGELVAQARDVLKKPETEKRELTSEEVAAYEKLNADIDNVNGEIEKADAAKTRADKLAKWEEDLKRPLDRAATPNAPAGSPVGKRATPEYLGMFRKYLLGGPAACTDAEMLALQTDSDSDGGYIVTQEQFATELLKNLDDQVQVRDLARKFAVKESVTFSVPARTAKASTFGWTQEVVAPSIDSSYKLGKRKLMPHYLSGEIDVSRDLLRVAVLSVDEIVRYELARDAGELQENGFLTGTGSQQPLGLFTASNDGIDTSRDVSTGNSTTAMATDGLLEALYSLKYPYQANASWLFHRTALKNIRKLKDGMGQYIWQPGLRAGEPDTLFARPVAMSEFAPSTFTTGLYVGLVGDFQFYWIVDGLDMEIMVLNELLARTNQVAYLARMKTDGMPVKAEAFARVTLA